MKRRYLGIAFPVPVLIIVLTGCGVAPTAVPASPTVTERPGTPTVSVSMTPDPCAPGQIEAEVQKVHRHMREFDDASVLASNVPREQLSDAIANLQRIRREAEDEPVPVCLKTLKAYQVEHMNTVINTLMAFLSGSNRQTADQGIGSARQQHDQYALELARVLGLTVVTTTAEAITATETPAP